MPEDFKEKKMPSDCYQEHWMALLEESAIASLDYSNSLLVISVKKYAKVFQEFNALFQARKAKQALILITFVVPIRSKSVPQEKRKCKSFTLQKALDEKEIDDQQWRRA